MVRLNLDVNVRAELCGYRRHDDLLEGLGREDPPVEAEYQSRSVNVYGEADWVPIN